MALASRRAKIYLEDTIKYKETGTPAVVFKVWHDIESRIDSDGFHLEEGQFEVWMLRNRGIFAEPRDPDAPTGGVSHEDDDDWELQDRSFCLGDVCKLDSSSAMSGIVKSSSMTLKVRNVATREIREVKGDEIRGNLRYDVGEYVVKDDWVGKVSHSDSCSIVKFEDGSAAICDSVYVDALEIEEEEEFSPIRHPTGTIVEVSKEGMKKVQLSTVVTRPQHKHKGSARGIVCSSYTHQVQVSWQFQNMMRSKFDARPSPQEIFSLADLQKGALRDHDEPIHDHAYQVGDIVSFRNSPAVSYSLNFYADNDFQTLKSICTDWEVIATQQTCKVQWQDGTYSENLSKSLIPYLHVDELDLWPSDNIVSMKSGKEGIVQTVDAQDRTAVVRWSSREVEEMSLYELRNNGAYNVDLGDLVLLVPEDGQVQQSDSLTWGPGAIVTSISKTLAQIFSVPDVHSPSSSSADTKEVGDVDWFGVVESIDEQGMCGVSLYFSTDPRTIYVPLSRLIHVSNDDSSIGSSSYEDGSDIDIDSTDSDSSAWTESGSRDVRSAANGDSVYGVTTWVDPQGQIVDDQPADGWEDDDGMEQDSDDEDIESDDQMVDVVAEEITQPATTDIVLDAQAESFVPEHDESRSVHEQIAQSRSTSAVDAKVDYFPSDSEHLPSFSTLEAAADDHTYLLSDSSVTGPRSRRIFKEFQTLKTSLPRGILVRTYESRIDLLRVLIIGPRGTPYENAPMLFDCYLPSTFPDKPPSLHFFSWTDGIGRINPNLYEDGNVCLSLLGTWHGDSEASETWTPSSTLLQLFVSLQALVLVKDPYYNEAGYDVLSGKDNAVAAANYSERAYVLTRGFVKHVLENPIAGFEREIKWLYLGEPQYLALVIRNAERVVTNSENNSSILDSSECITKVSRGALILLRRTLLPLRAIVGSITE